MTIRENYELVKEISQEMATKAIESKAVAAGVATTTAAQGVNLLMIGGQHSLILIQFGRRTFHGDLTVFHHSLFHLMSLQYLVMRECGTTVSKSLAPAWCRLRSVANKFTHRYNFMYH